ncbi:Protein FAM71D, partial [Chaetura pelagica]
IGKMDSKFDFKGISSSQTSIMGDLRRLLNQGEYSPFTCAPIFESKFVEVKSPSNEIIWCAQDKIACNDYPFFTPSTASSYPSFSGICRFDRHSIFKRNLHLCLLYCFPFFNRFLPLELVELAVHSRDHHHLMIKLVNGRSYYLELCAPPDQQEHLFHLWLQLISLLKPPENT